jgi:hypothetical protein
MDNFISNIFPEVSTPGITLTDFLQSVGVAVLMGIIISFIHHKTDNKNGKVSPTLLILPAVCTIIIMLIGGSVARAFSLAGAFTLVRFRSIPTTPKELIYVLISIAIGLGCGMGLLIYAILTGIILCLMMILFECLKSTKYIAKILEITIAEDFDYSIGFTDIFDTYLKSYELTEIKTEKLGTGYRLTYKVLLKIGANEQKLVSEIQEKQGVNETGRLPISLSTEGVREDF